MSAKTIAKIFSVIQWPYGLVLLGLALGSWLFYKLVLRDLSQERHKIFARLFRELLSITVLGATAYAAQLALTSVLTFYDRPQWPTAYSGLIVIFLWARHFIKIAEIVANEYFFFKSMKAGVPLLLVNVSSLILSLILLGWSLTYLFDVKVTSVIATSAVFTIVLGLAMQDTLGNLFAAISLQIDKPFEMDDWIELRNGSDKIAGQVKELTWRATLLQSLTDEMITIPNRTIAQWQIMNFSARTQPFLRGQVFRIPLDASVSDAKAALKEAMWTTPELLKTPAPTVIITETTESWIALKAIYYVSDYGFQYIAADRFYERALEILRRKNIALATDRLQIDRETTPRSSSDSSALA